MDGMVSLGRVERWRLSGAYRRHPNPDVRRRARGVLSLGMGWSGSRVAKETFLRAARQVHGLQSHPDRSLAAWLTRTAKGDLRCGVRLLQA